jgi:hypothetical protein
VQILRGARTCPALRFLDLSQNRVGDVFALPSALAREAAAELPSGEGRSKDAQMSNDLQQQEPGLTTLDLSFNSIGPR